MVQNGCKIWSFLPVFSLFWCFFPDLWMEYWISISVVDISANLENIKIKQCKWCHLVTKFWANWNKSEYIFKWNTNLIWSQYKWRHLVVKLVTNESSTTCWPKLEPMKSLTWLFLSTEFSFFSAGNSSYGLNTLGPLCLWQCFFSKSKLILIDHTTETQK